MLHPVSALHFYHKVCEWDREDYFKPALLSSREIWVAASQWDNERGGEGTICGGPTLGGGLPSVQTTCWKPRGGAQADSLGSARLPGAAAPSLSQGLSCSRNTTRNCNPSQSQHPVTLPPCSPIYNPHPTCSCSAQEAPLLLNAIACSAVQYQFNALTSFSFSEALCRAVW